MIFLAISLEHVIYCLQVWLKTNILPEWKPNIVTEDKEELASYTSAVWIKPVIYYYKWANTEQM